MGSFPGVVTNPPRSTAAVRFGRILRARGQDSIAAHSRPPPRPSPTELTDRHFLATPPVLRLPLPSRERVGVRGRVRRRGRSRPPHPRPLSREGRGEKDGPRAAARKVMVGQPPPR